MKLFFSLLIAVFLMAQTSLGQVAYSDAQSRVFDGKGSDASIAAIVKAAGDADVVFLGEEHDDAVGHAFQAEVFRRLVEAYSSQRPIVLSLEMFEHDVQIVLDEYLAGLISEQHFLSSSRPWGNYKTDYRPLVELAREKKLSVIAANAPRRYVNMVSRGGRGALDRLSKNAKSWIAPLPYAEASPQYSQKFKALMGPSAEAQMGIDNILSSQSLWDATMAYWITDGLKRQKNALVVHLNGSFHTASRLGTVEHLLRYRPKTRAIVVTMKPETDFKSFDQAKYAGLGDFVVLTDGSVPRSKR